MSVLKLIEASALFLFFAFFILFNWCWFLKYDYVRRLRSSKGEASTSLFESTLLLLGPMLFAIIPIIGEDENAKVEVARKRSNWWIRILYLDMALAIIATVALIAMHS